MPTQEDVLLLGADAPPAEPETEEPGSQLAVPDGPSPLDAIAAMPIVPGGDEIRHLAQLAVTFAASTLVPKALQGKPNDVFLVMMTARDLGLVLTTALRECHPIDGRVTVSPKLKLALVRMRGLGRVWPHQPPRTRMVETPDGLQEITDKCSCGADDDENGMFFQKWHAARADDPSTVYTYSYTWRDSQIAGLVTRACAPDDHSEPCIKGQGNYQAKIGTTKCKSNYFQYPANMIKWRAMGYLMDEAFGEVGTGLYSADELGAISDEDGYIDIREVGAVEGLSDGSVPKADRPEGWVDPDKVCSAEDQATIRALIDTLPDPAKSDLAEMWRTVDADTGNPKLLPLTRLPNKQVKTATALIEMFRTRAKRKEWGPGWPKDLAEPEAITAEEAQPSQEQLDRAPAAIELVANMVLIDVEEALEAIEITPVGHEPDDRATLAHHYAMNGLPLPANPEFDVDEPPEGGNDGDS